MRRGVITGLGPITSVGIGKKAVWEGLQAARTGIGWVTRFDSSTFNARGAGEVKDWLLERHFPPHRLKRLDRYAQFAVGSVALALQDAGLSHSPDRPRPRSGSVSGRPSAGWLPPRPSTKRSLRAGQSRCIRLWRSRFSEALPTATPPLNLACAAWARPIPTVAPAATCHRRGHALHPRARTKRGKARRVVRNAAPFRTERRHDEIPFQGPAAGRLACGLASRWR
jgi:hypothetical protein